MPELDPNDRAIPVYVETTTRRRATFSINELAALTGESVEDITANIENRTMRAWAVDYLMDAPNLIAAMDAAPDAAQTTGDPSVRVY